jgi:hypothetical protein
MTERKLKPFTGDLKATILAAAASVGADGNGKGGLLGYCDRLAQDKDPKVAAQGRALRQRLEANPLTYASKEGRNHVE